MATKPTKKRGETSTTVSVGLRLDPKVKFALDTMSRIQKRSITAVVEWAVLNAVSQMHTATETETYRELIDKVWSTDASTRFANMALHIPEALSYDEMRLWETIQATPELWVQAEEPTEESIAIAARRKQHIASKPALAFWQVLDEPKSPNMLSYNRLRAVWTDLLLWAEEHKADQTVSPLQLSESAKLRLKLD